MVTALVMTSEDGIVIKWNNVHELVRSGYRDGDQIARSRLLTGVETPWCVPLTVTVKPLKFVVSPAM